MSSQAEHQQPAPKKPRLVFTDLQRRTLQAIFKVSCLESKMANCESRIPSSFWLSFRKIRGRFTCCSVLLLPPARLRKWSTARETRENFTCAVFHAFPRFSTAQPMKNSSFVCPEARGPRRLFMGTAGDYANDALSRAQATRRVNIPSRPIR